MSFQTNLTMASRTNTVVDHICYDPEVQGWSLTTDNSVDWGKEKILMKKLVTIYFDSVLNIHTVSCSIWGQSYKTFYGRNLWIFVKS